MIEQLTCQSLHSFFGNALNSSSPVSEFTVSTKSCVAKNLRISMCSSDGFLCGSIFFRVIKGVGCSGINAYTAIIFLLSFHFIKCHSCLKRAMCLSIHVADRFFFTWIDIVAWSIRFLYGFYNFRVFFQKLS